MNPKMAAPILAGVRGQGWGLCSLGCRQIFRREICFQLDEKTAHSSLDLFKKNTGVLYRMLGIDPTRVSQNPERFRDWAVVLGDTTISRGCHYWEVTVKRSKQFRIGVAEVDIPREVCIGMDDNSWVFAYGHQCWNAMFANENSPIAKIGHPEKVGLFLDYDRKKFSLIDIEQHKFIHTMSPEFRGPLVPAFALWDGQLLTHSGLDIPEKLKQS
ncbi:SPRY domain-containing protein 4 [Erythrolamprus reginae]|uniref:SPRY domain-containing protein 4 n=1 Tax=Erythrolamprus reginae TaxID=121349 RepID=UPI00396CA753